MHSLDTALAAAKEACLKAAPVILKGYADASLEIGSKTDGADVYTPVDAEAERIIRNALKNACPEFGFIGEEGGEEQAAAEYCWVVDPLDGTSNYSHKLPHFGTSIALLKNGKTVLGVLHFPVSGDTYAAVEGRGATKNNEPIRIQDRTSMSQSLLAEMFSDRVHRGTEVLYPPGIAYRRFGSAITSLAFLAEGKVHGVFLRCHLWDVAAASFIAKEAGAEVLLQRTAENTVACAVAVPGIFGEFANLVRTSYYPELRPGDAS